MSNPSAVNTAEGFLHADKNKIWNFLNRIIPVKKKLSFGLFVISSGY
jgi:hypothetical protein